jgi:hypothetical protein
MAKSKKVVYEVICPNNPRHIFPFAFEIEPGSENVQSKVEAYCPQCDAFVQVTVKGKLPPNQDILRQFDIP